MNVIEEDFPVVLFICCKNWFWITAVERDVLEWYLSFIFAGKKFWKMLINIFFICVAGEGENMREDCKGSVWILTASLLIFSLARELNTTNHAGCTVLLLFNKLSRCSYMVRKSSISAHWKKFPKRNAFKKSKNIYFILQEYPEVEILKVRALPRKYHCERGRNFKLTCLGKVKKILIHRKRTYSWKSCNIFLLLTCHY